MARLTESDIESASNSPIRGFTACTAFEVGRLPGAHPHAGMFACTLRAGGVRVVGERAASGELFTPIVVKCNRRPSNGLQ